MTKKSRLLAARIFGIIFIIAGLIVSFISGLYVFDRYEMISASDISYKYMDNFEYYNFKELTVIDCYDQYRYHDDSITDEWYYIVEFDDAGGSKCYASMMIETDKDIFDDLREYAENPTGDYKINAVVTYVCPIEESVGNEKTINAYRQAVSKLNDSDIIDSGYGFDYCGVPENFDTYVKEQESADRTAFIIGIIIFIIGIALTVLGFKTSLKEAKQHEEDILINYGQGNNQYTYTGTYYTPPSNDNNFNT